MELLETYRLVAHIIFLAMEQNMGVVVPLLRLSYFLDSAVEENLPLTHLPRCRIMAEN